MSSKSRGINQRYKSGFGQIAISLFHSKTKRTTLVLVLETQGSECLKHLQMDMPPMDTILDTKWRTAMNFCLHQNLLEKGIQVSRFYCVVETNDKFMSLIKIKSVKMAVSRAASTRHRVIITLTHSRCIKERLLKQFNDIWYYIPFYFLSSIFLNSPIFSKQYTGILKITIGIVVLVTHFFNVFYAIK